MITFYRAFVKNMTALCGPLNRLPKKNIEFEWHGNCEKAFQEATGILKPEMLLTHFNPDLPIIVSADTFSYGHGAVLFHRFEDGTLKAV